MTRCQVELKAKWNTLSEMMASNVSELRGWSVYLQLASFLPLHLGKAQNVIRVNKVNLLFSK